MIQTLFSFLFFPSLPLSPVPHCLDLRWHPVTVLTDHKNLKYYRKPQNINRRVARYIPHLANYNFTLAHIPGPTNKVDTLSRRPDYDDGSNDNTNIIVLPPQLFTPAITFSSLDNRARACQLQQQPLLSRWAGLFSLKKVGNLYWYGDRLVIVDNLPLRRGVISLYHDSPTAGHPGISNTTWAIARDYWWPSMKQTITDYIKGCTLCQSRKNQPNRIKPPPIPHYIRIIHTPLHVHSNGLHRKIASIKYILHNSHHH